MKKVLIILCFVFLFSFSSAIPTYHQFYGSVENGSGDLVLDSKSIVASIGGNVVGFGDSENGLYGYSPLFLVEDGEDGEVISFYVDGYFSVNYTFEKEETTELNLTLNLSEDLTCIDYDKDGFNVSGGSCGVVDCNDNSSLINQGRDENCSTSYDDNCDGNVNEGCSTTTTTGGSSGGGGGGGGGGDTTTIVDCVGNWTCGDWNPCVNSVQYRICADVNNCNLISSRPVVSRDCEVDSEGEERRRIEEEMSMSSSVLNWKGMLIVGGLIPLIVVIILVILFMARPNRKRKSVGIKKN